MSLKDRGRACAYSAGRCFLAAAQQVLKMNVRSVWNVTSVGSPANRPQRRLVPSALLLAAQARRFPLISAAS
jgi:hypothetical protein